MNETVHSFSGATTVSIIVRRMTLYWSNHRSSYNYNTERYHQSHHTISDIDSASRDFCHILGFFCWDSVVNGLKTVWRMFLMKIHIISTIVILDVDLLNILAGFP